MHDLIGAGAPPPAVVGILASASRPAQPRLSDDIEPKPLRPNEIGFANRIDPDLKIDADGEQLYRMVLNLLRNAVEALAGRAGAQIEILAERKGRIVSLVIADNGPGIPKALQAKLFQPFATAARAGGSGLGLAIARDLARLHGGEMTLIATGPDGTQFRIDIPDREEG